MVEQSAGLSLDEYFDLQFDGSGDVASVNGVDELKKDLSIAVWEVVNDEIEGQVLTANVIVELESNIRTRVEQDERVDEISQLSVRRTGSGSVAEIDISVESAFGSFNQNINNL